MTAAALVILGLGALLVWSGVTGRSGFAELGKLLRGQAAFVAGERLGAGGPLTGGAEEPQGSGGGSGGAW